MRNINRFKPFLAIVFSGLLASCIVGTQSNRGSAVDNEVRVGVIYASGGKPAVNARVRVFPVGHLPDTIADTASGTSKGSFYSTRTDADGQYRIGDLPDGEYNILADQSGQFAMQDSIFLDKETEVVPADTLEDPGSLSGVVQLQPNHDPRYAIVQVLGTNYYANVDAAGRFRLNELAEGKYTLRIFTSLPDYMILFKSVSIRKGADDSLQDTLVPDYLGIPVVLGLEATFDTLNAIVSLSWNSVSYRDFSLYQIYRDEVPVLETSTIPIGTTRDTVFQDNLKSKLTGPLTVPGSGRMPAYEYRIRIKNKSNQIGLSYGDLEVSTPPPDVVTTDIVLEVENVAWDSAKQADSVRIVATLKNPTRKLVSLAWAIGNPADSLPLVTLGGVLEAQQFLRYGWNKEGPYTVYLKVVDDAGTVWRDSVNLKGNVAPTVSGTPAQKVKAYEAYDFTPVSSDTDADKLRFSIANAPKWASFDSLTGALKGTPANADSGDYPGIEITVSDGRRIVKSEVFQIKVSVNAWSPGPRSPIKNTIRWNLGNSAVNLNGKIYFIGDSVWSCDTEKGIWNNEAAIPDSIVGGITVTSIEGKILLFQTMPGVLSEPTTYRTTSFDPVSKRWEHRAAFPDITIRHYLDAGAVVDGVFYAIGGGQVLAYDASMDTWTEKKKMPANLVSSSNVRAHCVAVNGKIVVMGQEDQDRPNTTFKIADQVGIYDPTNDSWTNAAPIEHLIRNAIVAIDSKVYIAGGYQVNGNSSQTQEYDFTTGTWKRKSPMPRAISSMWYAESGGKLFLFNGDSGTTNPTPTDETWIYDPSLDP